MNIFFAEYAILLICLVIALSRMLKNMPDDREKSKREAKKTKRALP